MKVKKFEVGETYTTVTGSMVTIKRRTAKMCEIVAYHKCGLIDETASGMRKVQLSLTNNPDYDRVEMLNPWGRFSFSVFA